MKSLKLLIFLASTLLLTSLAVKSEEKKSVNNSDVKKYEVFHPKTGDSIVLGNGKVKVKLHSKLQNYMGSSTPIHDPDINSPKSVNIHPSGTKFYVNSLEGGKTIAYSLPDLQKIAVIDHKFTATDSALWAPPSGLFKFRHYSSGLNCFIGKPVESEFSHNGRYLWVPYYRRSFDLNAQDPSAVAIIDTEQNKIIRMMEAGVLPKMIALSPDNKIMAITHWGDNTVGLIDISSPNPNEWHYIDNVAVGHQLFHNFSLTEAVNRDSNTGEALRGTVFTPDSRFLLVGCMSGGGIAVIDVKEKKYLGKILGMKPNLRHLVIKGDWLYVSINASGYVERIPLSKIISTCENMREKGTTTLSGWQSCKVDNGARTLDLSPKGDFIFVACNVGSALCVVDSSMNLVGRLTADSFPVGLAVSPDGKWVITTAQGRKGSGGGNCVDIFSVEGMESDFKYVSPEEEKLQAPIDSLKQIEELTEGEQRTSSSSLLLIISAIAVGLCCATVVFLFFKKKKRQ